MSKRGLPTGLQMRHDAHYVEELSQLRPTQVGRMIAVDKLDPNPEQPRVEFGDLTELTASIAEKGVLEPLLSLPPDASEKEVFEIFDKYNLRMLTIVDEDKRPVGAITVDDVVSRLLK